MLKQLILQIVLILCNAFFAATEIAVISLNEKKVRALASDGDKRAKKMLRIIETPTQFLSTIQIGITLAGFLGSAFAADNFAETVSAFLVRIFRIAPQHAGTMNTVAVVAVTLILSYFTLIFGELVPKRIAMKHKEKLANAVCGFISVLAANHLVPHRLHQRGFAAGGHRSQGKGGACFRGGHRSDAGRRRR